MSDQAAMNGGAGRGRGPDVSPTRGVGQGVGGLLHDVTELAELQFKLFGVDAKEASDRMVLPIVLVGAAAVLGLSATPLLLVAVAQLLRDQAGWPAAVATLAAVGIGLLLAAVLGGLGYVLLRRALAPFARSTEELGRNVNWLKETLKRGRPSAAATYPPGAIHTPAPGHPPVHPR